MTRDAHLAALSRDAISAAISPHSPQNRIQNGQIHRHEIPIQITDTDALSLYKSCKDIKDIVDSKCADILIYSRQPLAKDQGPIQNNQNMITCIYIYI